MLRPIALLLTLAAACVCPSLLAADKFPVDWKSLEPEILDYYSNLIRIDTSSPPGNETKAAEYLKKKLGVGWKELTADGRITLVEGECMGACGDAPVLLVNNKRMCSFMSPEKLDKLIEELH